MVLIIRILITPEYDLLYEAALYENNDRTRYELYKEMQLIIQEEVPVIPLFYAETFQVCK